MQPKGDYKLEDCVNCTSYKTESASLLQPFHPVDYNAFSEKTPTYNNLSLKDATKEFLKGYIPTAAKDYATTMRTQISDEVNTTREGLTKLIKNTGIDSKLEDVSETLKENPQYYMENDPIQEIRDPITKYVLNDARHNGYDLKQHVKDFKHTYANNMAKTYGFRNAVMELGYDKALELDTKEVIRYGVDDAAETLGISKRRMHDFVKDYYINHVESQDKPEDELSRMREAKKAEQQRINEIKEQERIDNEKSENPKDSLDDHLKAA